MREKPSHSATSAIIQSAPRAPADALATYCPDLEEWPKTWMYEARDLAPGQQLVQAIRPFLLHLLTLNLSGKTLRKHRDNLWLLGGEIISRLHETPRLRKRPMPHVVSEAIDNEGGLLISRNSSEEQQLSFDATCRRFHRFLKGNSRGG